MSFKTKTFICEDGVSTFTVHDIFDIQKRTGSGKMNYKKALFQANGDMDKVIQFCRDSSIVILYDELT